MSVGITNLVTLDGTEIDFAPDDVSVDPESNERVVSTMGDTFLYRDIILAGLPDIEERFRSITFPMGGMENDTERRRAQMLRVQGGFHTLALWVPERMVWTATTGQTLFYFGRRRRDAGIVYGRTGLFPISITRTSSGVATTQTVTIVAGSAPSVPAAGACNVATDPVASGSYKDYSAFALSACTAGDTIEAKIHPLLRVYVERPRVDFRSVVEQHDLVFVER